jgi:hypothetical protein
MIYLIVAPPGTGKTNYAIDLLWKLKKAKPFRPCFVSNLRGPKWDVLNAQPLETVAEWESLPDGSIVLVDEIQDQIPQRGKDKPPPDWLKEIAKHRHRGFDFIFTTQHASLVDVFIRRQTGEMIYLRRKARALSFLTFFKSGALAVVWDRYDDKPDDFLHQRNAVKRGFTYNKKAFTAYESTVLDTHKPKVPWQIFALIVGVVICGTLLYRGLSRFVGGDGSPAATLSAAQSASALAPDAPQVAAISGDQRMASFEPRIKGLPVSAPAYDYLTPSTIPKVFCMSSQPGKIADGSHRGASCTCITEQGTPVAADVNFCLSAALHGIYDPYKQDAMRQDSSGQGASAPSAVGASMAADAAASSPVGTSGDFASVAAYGALGVP